MNSRYSFILYILLSVSILGAGIFFTGRANYLAQTETIKIEDVHVRLVSLNPPKHVYIDAVDIWTGELYKDVYVSKHFNRWREVVIGSEIVLQREHYVFPNREDDKKTYVRWRYGSARQALDALVNRK